MSFELIEKNPSLVIGGAAVLVLLLSMRGSSGNAAAMIQAQLQAQKTAGATDVALARINAEAAQARTASVADVYKTSIVARAQVLGTQDTNAARVTLGMDELQAKQAAVASQERIAAQSIAASQATAAARLNAQIAMLQNNNDLQRYGLTLTAQNLPTILQSRLSEQQIAASNAQAIASISAQQAQAIAALNTQAARTQARAQAQSSTISDIGGLASIAGDILGGGGGLGDVASSVMSFFA
jgi:bacterioferritin (cytochrome b1)